MSTDKAKTHNLNTSGILGNIKADVYQPTFEFDRSGRFSNKTADKSAHKNADKTADKSGPHTQQPARARQAPTTSGIASALATSFAVTDDLLQTLKQRSFARDPLRDTGVTNPNPQQQKPFVRPPVFRPETQGKAPLGSRTRASSGSKTTATESPGAPAIEDRALRSIATAASNFVAQVDADVAMIKTIGSWRADVASSHSGAQSAGPPPKLLFSSGCRRFRVGKATSETYSTVQVFDNHLNYDFHHPVHRKKIQMLMFYKDMAERRFEGATFTFRIGRPLECFTQDYDFTKHAISVKFDNSVDVDRFTAQVWPCVEKLSHDAGKR